MSEWTEAPWEVSGAAIQKDFKTTICMMSELDAFDGLVPLPNSKANATRIVDCVNSLAKVKNPAAVGDVIKAADTVLGFLQEGRVPDLESAANLESALSALEKSQ